MIELYNVQTGEKIGLITEAQLQFLVEQLEEESPEDQDYAIAPMTIAYFSSMGADPQLLSILTSALGSQDELIIRWVRD